VRVVPVEFYNGWKLAPCVLLEMSTGERVPAAEPPTPEPEDQPPA